MYQFPCCFALSDCSKKIKKYNAFFAYREKEDRLLKVLHNADLSFVELEIHDNWHYPKHDKYTRLRITFVVKKKRICCFVIDNGKYIPDGWEDVFLVDVSLFPKNYIEETRRRFYENNRGKKILESIKSSDVAFY